MDTFGFMALFGGTMSLVLWGLYAIGRSKGESNHPPGTLGPLEPWREE